MHRSFDYLLAVDCLLAGGFAVFVIYLLVALRNSRGTLAYRNHYQDYLESHLKEIRRQNDLLERVAAALERPQ